MTNSIQASRVVEFEKSPTIGWELFRHDADVGVRGFGPTMEVAFEQAALAMTAAITDPRLVAPRKAIDIVCEAPDREFLFVEWLNALVYEMAINRMLFSRFAVKIQGSRLRAVAWGEPVDVTRHEPATEVKGATLTALEVSQGPRDHWTAQCIVDV